MACPLAEDHPAGGAVAAFDVASMTSSCRSEKLWTSSSATAAGTRVGRAPARRLRPRGSPGSAGSPCRPPRVGRAVGVEPAHLVGGDPAHAGVLERADRVAQRRLDELARPCDRIGGARAADVDALIAIAPTPAGVRAAQRGLGGGGAAAYGALHRVRPAGVGPRARQPDAGQSRRARRAGGPRIRPPAGTSPGARGSRRPRVGRAPRAPGSRRAELSDEPVATARRIPLGRSRPRPRP